MYNVKKKRCEAEGKEEAEGEEDLSDAMIKPLKTVGKGRRRDCKEVPTAQTMAICNATFPSIFLVKIQEFLHRRYQKDSPEEEKIPLFCMRSLML